VLDFCQGRLARYKQPRSVRLLDALQRTSAGKVDRRSLSAKHGTPG
jgi:fatty-acyl-CoA synthase